MIKVCGFCGEEYNARKNKQKFCSRKCVFESAKSNSKVKENCLWCGKEKEMYKSNWEQNENKNFYCDFKCRDEARKALTLDKNEEERMRNPWPEEECVWCGKTFKMFPYRLERNKTGDFYCTIECVREHRATWVGLLHPRATGEEFKNDYLGGKYV